MNTKSTPIKKRYLSPREFYRHCDVMVAQIIAAVQKGHRYKVIVFAPRGALPVVYEIISALGSDLLQLAAQINSYHDEQKISRASFMPKNLKLLTQVLAEFDPAEVLFVDDIYDSGDTQKTFVSHFPGVHTACVYARYENHPLNYCGQVVGNDDWLVFPPEERIVNDECETYPRGWKAKVI